MMTCSIRGLGRVAVAVMAVGATPPDVLRAQPAASPTPMAAFADVWLDRFARTHPSIAAGNGLHRYDDRLEDFSASAIRHEIAQLRRDRTTLAAMSDASWSADDRVDRRILLGIIDGWLLDLDRVRTWQRNPMIYAAAIADGVHDLMIKDATPAATRMAQVAAKLRAVPGLLAAARTNLQNPPAIFCERGAAMFDGAAGMVSRDLALAFPAPSPERDSLIALGIRTAPLLAAYATDLRALARTATGDWRVGADAVRARYAAEELIDLPLDTLLALAARELVRNQQAFADAARRVDATRPPRDVWAQMVRDHPARGGVVTAARTAVDSLSAFVARRGLAALPTDAAPRVAAAQPFAIGLASMHASPPLEPVPVPSYYYITDADSTWDASRQDAWLERFNRWSLVNTSAHEVMPGHWLHAMAMRATPGKVRRIWIGLNPFPQPSSGQDGWAHYAEQLVVDEGFGNGDPRYRMAQASDALTRIVRLVSGIRMHRGDWSIADAQQAFEREAYVPSAAARREAERSTYDPTNGGYFLGKLALLTLRADLQALEGAAFDLRRFHERVMRHGIAPWWAHRALMLPNDTRPVLR